jgi:hypothetical protein
MRAGTEATCKVGRRSVDKLEKDFTRAAAISIQSPENPQVQRNDSSLPSVK